MGIASFSLRPRAFQVLAYLVEHHGRLVSKSELLDRFWSRNVGDEVLNSSIMAARKAVGDDGRTQGIIKTVHGLGYRFVAPISVSEERTVEPDNGKTVRGDPVLAPPALASKATDQPPPASPGKEHRILTVMACAVADAATVAEQLGPELMFALMEDFFDKARPVLERHGGSVAQWSGDGFLAFFGAPEAHDDDVRRAALAALEITAASYSGGQSAGTHSVVAGLNTGPVLIGDLDQFASQRVFSARGKTTDIAMTLQTAAEPGKVLASESTYCQISSELEAAPQATNPPSYELQRVAVRQAGVPQSADTPCRVICWANRRTGDPSRAVGPGLRWAMVRSSQFPARLVLESHAWWTSS